MRVQFSVSPTEWSKLQHLASANSYPDVPSYCRDVALEERTYSTMWKTIVSGIAKMPSGSIFALRDLVQTPPTNLGRKLYENQKSLGIQVTPHKDSSNTNTFKKL